LTPRQLVLFLPARHVAGSIAPMPYESAGKGPWVATAIEQLVVRAAKDVRVLSALTPGGAQVERARLVAELSRGRRPIPRWSYARVPHDDLRRALDAAQRELAYSGDPLALLYLARARELAVEAALCSAAGTPDIARLARERFPPADPPLAREAAALCTEWLGETDGPAADPAVVSDDPDPRSLLSRMRREVGRLRLPFAVVADPALAPLAATGDSAILVATGRPVPEQDAIRTVLHEVEGHARPRARSRSAPIALLRVGLAGGADDQEGRALLLEERAGMLGPRRRRQLAARHRAVEMMLDGATFCDVARQLVEAHRLDPFGATIVAERVFRGSDGTRPGLGRERVYLESFLRVRAHLLEHPEHESVLGAGQIAVSAASEVRAIIGLAALAS
jgi:hypothetical protein